MSKTANYSSFSGFSPFGTAQNPTLDEGDIDSAGTVGAWTSSGDTIRYEWSVQIFDTFPGPPLPLSAGQRIGFDLVAADKDEAERGATWVSWSPAGGKLSNANRLGDVTLLGSAQTVAEMAHVQGRITLRGSDDGWPGMTVRLFDREDKNWASATSGLDGRFDLLGPEGEVYLLVPDAEPEARLELTLRSGATTQALIAIAQKAGPRLPLWPFVFILGLLSLTSCGAMWPLRRHVERLGGILHAPDTTLAQLATRPEWVGGSALAVLSAALVGIAMLNVLPGQLWGALLGMPGALSTILMVSIPLLLFLALVVLQFAAWMVWSALLWGASHVAGGRGRFFTVVSATGYASLPVTLGLVVSSMATAFGIGGEALSISPFTGLGLLDLASGPLNDALWRIELFHLWTWVLGALVVRHVMGLAPMRAGVVTAACWSMTLLLIFSFEFALRSLHASLTGLS